MLEIAVCDDNARDLRIILDMLQEICGQLNQEYHIAVYRSPDDMLDSDKKIDICILDVVMPDCNGIDLGRKLKEKFAEIELIYITSYEDYYKQVINKVHAFSLLTKPIDKLELRDQISECVRKIAGGRQGAVLVFENVRDGTGKEFASVNLDVNDILYCEYVKNQREVAIVLEREVYFYKVVFEKLLDQLESYGFAVNCRGSIVNFNHIRKLKGYTIYLDNGEELALTQKRVPEFKVKMNAFLRGKEDAFRR